VKPPESFLRCPYDFFFQGMGSFFFSGLIFSFFVALVPAFSRFDPDSLFPSRSLCYWGRSAARRLFVIPLIPLHPLPDNQIMGSLLLVPLPFCDLSFFLCFLILAQLSAPLDFSLIPLPIELLFPSFLLFCLYGLDSFCCLWRG